MDTYLSSRHFRNEILLQYDKYFNEFKQLAEETWNGLRIRSFDYDKVEGDISLLIQDAGFPSEIGLMGSGIQMWLQIMWFISRSYESQTVILDEPDVYMHPEMQLKILKIMQARFKQVIIATHSVEIITNVPLESIVTLNKKDRRMCYANDIQEVQNIIDDIGSIYNLSLIRLNSSNKCLFIEGKDTKILQRFFNILYPDSFDSFDMIPSLPLGGFSKISTAYGASNLFYSNSKGCFKCYALLDRDYYADDKIDELRRKAKENNLILHVWRKKEIENYIIDPNILFRLLPKGKLDYSDFLMQFESLVESFKQNLVYQQTTKIQEDNKGMAAGTAAKLVTDYISSKWTALDEKLKITPGKELLKEINGWMKKTFGISCSMNTIFSHMEPKDIDKEIVYIINMLMDIEEDKYKD